MPRLAIRQGDQQRSRQFPDRLPIGITSSGPAVFSYMATDPSATIPRLPCSYAAPASGARWL